jgi:hypothetical protein
VVLLGRLALLVNKGFLVYQVLLDRLALLVNKEYKV